MIIGKFTLSTELRDRCCFSTNEEIFIIKNIIRIEEQIYLIVSSFQSTADVYDVGASSSSVGVYSCGNLKEHLTIIPLRNVKNKIYMMPKWSHVEGQEERTVKDEWICAELLSPLQLPDDY